MLLQITKFHLFNGWVVFHCLDVVAESLSHVQLSTTPWTVVCQAPLCMGFPRQEYWSGLPSPPSEDPGTEPTTPAWLVGSLPLSHLGSPCICVCVYMCVHFLYPFIYWWALRWFAYLDILAIVNNSTYIVGYVSFLISGFFFSGYISRSSIDGSYSSSIFRHFCLFFKETPYCFPQWPIYILISSVQGFDFIYILDNFFLIYISQSHRYEVTFHYGFDLHYLDD